MNIKKYKIILLYVFIYRYIYLIKYIFNYMDKYIRFLLKENIINI